MQLPLSLLKAAVGSPVLVELKGGDTYNGRLQSADAWMNMNLQEVICTSSTGDRFWKLPACYIRGSAIKYLRLLPAVLDQAVEEEAQSGSSSGGRGGGGYQGRGGGREGGRGRGRGRGGREGRGRGRGGRDGGRGRDGGGGRGRGGRSEGQRD